MRVTIEVPLSSISYKGKLAVNPKVMLFAIQMLRGDKFPPLTVTRDGNGTYQLEGGRHRFSAYRLIGRNKVTAYVSIPQEPYPYKDLVCGADSPVVKDAGIPQADGCSLPHSVCLPE